MSNETLWYPETYCQSYHSVRCVDPYDGPPHYPNVPVFNVVDLAARFLRPARADFWRKARSRALEQWEEAGIEFDVVETMGGMGYTPGRITLNLTDTTDGTRGQSDFSALPGEGELPAPGVAWAHIDTAYFEDYWQGRFRGPLVKVIGHEIGHTLGFGHNPYSGIDGGIMSTFAEGRVIAEEREAVKRYWL